MHGSSILKEVKDVRVKISYLVIHSRRNITYHNHETGTAEEGVEHEGKNRR